MILKKEIDFGRIGEWKMDLNLVGFQENDRIISKQLNTKHTIEES